MSAAFTVKPDFEIIRKYYFNSVDKEYFYNTIEDFKNTGSQYNSHIAETEEERIEFEDDFSEILIKYDISDHYDNLLYICLYLYENNWDVHGSWQPYYESEKRAVQLAKLVQFFQNITDDKTIDITVKNGSKKAKVDDKHLSNWIKKVVLEAVKTANFPLVFGDYTICAFTGLTPEGLIDICNRRPKNPRVDYNNAVVSFCLSLYQYINHETDLKASEGSTFSDAQVNFLFEVCCLFGMLSPDNISTEPKDYMRSILSQYINRNITH